MPTPPRLSAGRIASPPGSRRVRVIGRGLGMISLVLLAGPVLAAPYPAPTAQASAPAVSTGGDGEGGLRARVLALLDADEAAREVQWRKLGPESVPVLAALAMDRSASHERRAVAVSFLARVDPPRGADSIREVLEDGSAPVDVRASAALALGTCQGVDAMPVLIRQLEDRNATVREAVALALGRLGGLQARQALEDRVPREELSGVREALQRGLALAEP